MSLKIAEKSLKKSLKSAWIFFLETCTHHDCGISSVSAMEILQSCSKALLGLFIVKTVRNWPNSPNMTGGLGYWILSLSIKKMHF